MLPNGPCTRIALKILLERKLEGKKKKKRTNRKITIDVCLAMSKILSEFFNL